MRLSRDLPLRHSLAIAMSVMAAAGVFLTVLVAERELTRLDRAAAMERLQLVVERLENAASRSAEQRLRVKEATARDEMVIAALRDGRVDEDALAEALSPLRTPADEGLPVQLWTVDGRVVYSDVAEAAAGLAPERGPPAPHIPLEATPAYGAFHEVDGDVVYYSTSPVSDNGRLLGWVVQRRRIGSPAAADAVAGLVGPDVRVLFHYPGDSLWITLAGERVTAPLAQPPQDTTLYYEAGGERVLVRGRAVQAAPWSLLVEMPNEVIGGAAGRFVQRTLVGGLLLIVAGAAVATLLSRRLTRGLRRLSDATEDVARGNYTARVAPDIGGEEMSRLAAAFNGMAAQVAASHQAMEQQLREARRLTEELSAANVQAEDARARAESADRAKSDFLATMSHEIRTPINAVLGFCQVMELESLPAEKRQEYLGRTQRAARQLAALVEDVLDMSRINSGALTVQRAPVQVRVVVDGVCALLGDSIARRQLRLQVAVPQDLIVVADAQRMQQVLLNLVSNAVKFTPEGGTITVCAAPPHDGSQVAIVVEDSGIGIAPDQLERIFEPFVQAHTGYTRQFGGTGLGLNISRRLARLMDGDVVADSTPGAGSRFTLLLPSEVAAPAGM